MSIQLLTQLQDYFSVNNYNLEFVDIGESMMRSRMIKSAEEHALIRNGAHIADVGGYAVCDAIQQGMNREHEIAMYSTNQMIREIATIYGQHHDIDLMDTWVWLQSGINTDGAHNVCIYSLYIIVIHLYHSQICIL